MPGLQSETVLAAAPSSPVKKSRLSLKFFQKKETKRALDFSESQPEDKTLTEPDCTESCDQIVPAPEQCSPPACEQKDALVPFVGLNNLGNTCYLNSILQVLYYCPGFKDAVRKLHAAMSRKKENQKDESENKPDGAEDALPIHMELVRSLQSLITSMEQLQSSFLFNPKKFSDTELATPPRRMLSTLRQLNPMYEGYLQHDAQEVLQCILGYIQEACESVKKEQKGPELPNDVKPDLPVKHEEVRSGVTEEAASKSRNELVDKSGEEENSESQTAGKRKSDTEAGNAKKKSKPLKGKVETVVPSTGQHKHFTRSKRKSSSGEVCVEAVQSESDPTVPADNAPKAPGKRLKRSRLSWLRPSGKQPSIFSKFYSMGKISSHTGAKEEDGGVHAVGKGEEEEELGEKSSKEQKQKEESLNKEDDCFDLVGRMFHGQLVLRTRCLECECFTERREEFQDISVPVQEDEQCQHGDSSKISPDPKLECKTLKWAISQFASVERIVGEDKYFCETCHHYTEAERSLLFDKTPEVVTIHLKCFAANSSEIDPYAGLYKVNTPLQTPLMLSLEEWYTRSTQEHYELFAVVMHSGVTISSGHYTTYIRMMDLKEVKLELLEGGAKPEETQEYDDGEVSFSLSGKPHPPSSTNKLSSKKLSDGGVGLLGGQRSTATASFELGTSKQVYADKGVVELSSASQRHNSTGKTKDNKDMPSQQESGTSPGSSVCHALCRLTDYEGKWMLFDDSEVRLCEEEDFLHACSPETSTTSTPYLLFYKRVQQ